MNTFLIVILLWFHNNPVSTEYPDSLMSARDSLLSIIKKDYFVGENRVIDERTIELFTGIIELDNQMLSSSSNSSIRKIENMKLSLKVLNDKIDKIQDRKTKLERTILTLVLVLLMLTYYVFKLQRKSANMEE